MKRMLAASAHARSSLIDLSPALAQRTITSGAPVHKVAHPYTLEIASVSLVPIGPVPVQLVLFAMDQRGQLLHVRLSRIRGGQAVHQPGFVCAHMHLHAEEPRVALLGLLHLRIAALRAVL